MQNLPRDIQRKLKKLAALESGGVDNWDGYDLALEDYNKEEAAEYFIDELLVLICTECSIEQPAGSGCGYSIRDVNDVLLKFTLENVNEFKNN